MPRDIRYLSQRRKNQLINRELHNSRISDLSQSVNSNSTVPKMKEEVVNSFIKNDTSCRISNILVENLNEFNEYSFNEISELHSDIESDQENIIDSDNIPALVNTCDNLSLNKDLQMFIIEYNISHNAANKLLHILRKHSHIELPKDIRSLVHTPKSASINIKCVSGGHYIHFGLSSGLKRSIQTYYNFIKTNEIKLNINIDGLPISKSSNSQLWPIMASLCEIDVYTLPIIIGIYHGMHKPNNANEFLTDFVNEFINLTQTGIIVDNETYTVTINALLCDAPAKSFVTDTKGHTGYFACSKCMQEGDFVHNRIIFPETHNTLRTNDTFKCRTQIEHHTGDSILEKLSIGMVSQIPLDYMHLVCLGVMKRMLQLWIRGNKDIRLSTADIDLVSRHLMSIKSYIPSDFARKPRTLCDIDR